MQELLTEFGQTLAKIGSPVWRIQADALSRTKYAGGEQNHEVWGRSESK